MRISKTALSLALSSVLVLVGVMLSIGNESNDAAKENDPAVQSAAGLDTDKQTARAIKAEVSPELAADDNAVYDDFTVAHDLSAVIETEKMPVETMTEIDSQTDADSIDQTVKPEVIGSEVLAREAMGIRKMSKAMLRKWRLDDILPK